MTQRLAIGRLFFTTRRCSARRPDTGLDPASAETLARLIRSLGASNRAILLTTHNLSGHWRGLIQFRCWSMVKSWNVPDVDPDDGWIAPVAGGNGKWMIGGRRRDQADSTPGQHEAGRGMLAFLRKVWAVCA